MLQLARPDHLQDGTPVAGQFFVGFNAHNGKVAFSILRDENWFRIIMTKCRNFIVIIP